MKEFIQKDPKLATAADIVAAQAKDGVVPTDLYIKGNNLGLDVDGLIESAEELYDIAEDEIENTLCQ